MKILPQRDLLLVEIKKQDKTDSGLVITSPDIILERAIVLEVGPYVKVIKKGDEVLFKSWAIDVVKIDDKDYIHLAEDKVLSIIKK
jgi:co-chaperonin GroES (HSP10)